MPTYSTTSYENCTDCCGECPATLEITLADINAAICTGCVEASIANPDILVTSVAVDGDYTVSYTGEASGLCLYSYTGSVFCAAWTEYASTDGTCSGGSTLVVANEISIAVTTYKVPATKPIFSLSVVCRQTSPLKEKTAWTPRPTYTGPWDYGETIPNGLACPPPSPFTSALTETNGTGVVTLT